VSGPALAAEPDVDKLAKDLAQPVADCPTKLPDGSCPDQPDTRQIVLGGSGASAKRTTTSTASHAVRQDISMTFASGSANLTAGAKATLDKFAAALMKVATYRPFTVEGHTDSKGSRELNQRLSQARADAVVSYLSDKGVDKSRMTAKGFGFDKPLAGVPSADSRNRRVEVAAN
jgi:outer membrane protein OmpA-like peptidoglycan-associated protein